jgi:uncharacterized protein YoxC
VRVNYEGAGASRPRISTSVPAEAVATMLVNLQKTALNMKRGVDALGPVLEKILAQMMVQTKLLQDIAGDSDDVEGLLGDVRDAVRAVRDAVEEGTRAVEHANAELETNTRATEANTDAT